MNEGAWAPSVCAGQLEQSLLETLRQSAAESDPEDAAAAAQEGGAPSSTAAAERLAQREARQAERLAAALGHSRALMAAEDAALLPGSAEAVLGPRMEALYRQVGEHLFPPGLL